MPLSDAGENVMLDAWAAAADFISLHSADPGTTGASEIAGGAPAYARQAAVWGAATAGTLDLTNAPEFDVPAGATVSHWGAWSLVSGGTYLGGGALSTTENYTGQGVHTLADADLSLA